MADKPATCQFRRTEFVNPGDPNPRRKTTVCGKELVKGRCPDHGKNVKGIMAEATFTATLSQKAE